MPTDVIETNADRLRIPTVWRRALVLLAIAVLAAACGRSPGGLVFVDQAAALDRAQIEAAAAPLIELGVTVAVFSAANGAANGDDFTRRLDAAGLLRSGQIAPAVIALYVSFEPRYSEFRVGADWSTALPDAALRDVRLDLLNPALRAGNPTSGVVAALAALDERARFGPFGMRRDYALAALWIIVWAGIVLLLFGRSLGDWLRWSRVGRFCSRVVAWLWVRTPPGRAQARRRFLEQRDRAWQRVQAAAAEAHTVRQALAIIPDDLQARLESADHRYAQLEQPAADDALPAALDALTNVYRQLQVDLAAFERKLKQLTSALATRAAQACERMARVQASFQRASAPSRRSWKARRTISAAGRQRLDELQARQAQLDQQRATFEQAALPLAERHNRLAQLTHDYATLYVDATNLWQAECPRDYTASISAQQSQSYDSATSDSSASSPSSTSSSSDYSSDWSSTSSSEPSSDGGTW